VRSVFSLIFIISGAGRSLFRATGDLALENLALRHQIGILRRALGDRPARFRDWDRALWVVLARYWTGWRCALAIVQPATVIRWHREGFKRFWTRKSSGTGRRGGRPGLDRDIVELIKKMSRSNVTWGAPRIRNELAKLGIEVALSSVAKYMVRERKPRSPTWRAFLDSHVKDLVAIDFFVVPTATFSVLFGFLVLAHDRRRVLHFNVTASPTAEWTARQLVQAFPEETAPRFLVRDRDQIYGDRFRRMVEVLGMEEVVTAARSPWQNAYAERLIGSLRRECLDHVVILGELHLLRILAEYFAYYSRARCHLSLLGDAPEPRPVQGPALGKVVELPEVGGLHHRYERERAAA
jgi:putative transposase